MAAWLLQTGCCGSQCLVGRRYVTCTPTEASEALLASTNVIYAFDLDKRAGGWVASSQRPFASVDFGISDGLKVDGAGRYGSAAPFVDWLISRLRPAAALGGLRHACRLPSIFACTGRVLTRG